MLAVKVFTLAFDPILAAFNDAPVREFLADKATESVSDHFFTQDGAPFLVLVVCYRLAALPANAETPAKPGRVRDESWREALAEQGDAGYLVISARMPKSSVQRWQSSGWHPL